MHEQIAEAAHYAEVHLFCASMVWLAAWALTSIVRRGTAAWKYWIWVATSLNFILPLDIIVGQFVAWRPSRPSWAGPLAAIGTESLPNIGVLPVLWTVWLLGATLMSVRLIFRLRAEHAAGQSTARQFLCRFEAMPFVSGIPVKFSASPCGPGVHGFLRPHILLPGGIDCLLDEQELNAVLIHEQEHARRRDNLISLIHEVSLCVLWFHPFVWMTGRQLTLYRELSCDDAVIRSAHGGYLISALAKLVLPQDSRLLYAAASSFLEHRLARLTAGQPHRPCTPTSLLSVVAFSLILLTGVLGAAAQTAGNSYKPNTSACSRIRNNSFSAPDPTKAPLGGVKGGISSGVRGGVPNGVAPGIPSGVSGGVPGGVPGGIR